MPAIMPAWPAYSPIRTFLSRGGEITVAWLVRVVGGGFHHNDA
jgi:hypothetical protein